MERNVTGTSFTSNSKYCNSVLMSDAMDNYFFEKTKLTDDQQTYFEFRGEPSHESPPQN